jgi:hypothetical protein
MQAQETPNNAVATRLVASVRTFARSEVGWKAKLIFAAILVLLLGANGLNVANSFVNRNLMPPSRKGTPRHSFGRLSLRLRSSRGRRSSPFWRASPKNGSACFGANL